MIAYLLHLVTWLPPRFLGVMAEVKRFQASNLGIFVLNVVRARVLGFDPYAKSLHYSFLSSKLVEGLFHRLIEQLYIALPDFSGRMIAFLLRFGRVFRWLGLEFEILAEVLRIFCPFRLVHCFNEELILGILRRGSLFYPLNLRIDVIGIKQTYCCCGLLD